MLAARVLLLTLLIFSCNASWSATSQEIGDYEIHYNVFDSTMLQPKTAAALNLLRSANRKILNVSIRQKNSSGNDSPKAAFVKGTIGDLIQKTDLEFIEVREAGAIYYLSQFLISNETHYQFKLLITPDPEKPSIPINFSRQLFIDLKKEN